jgi:co-chaperonin GroES (HSP10)
MFAKFILRAPLLGVSLILSAAVPVMCEVAMGQATAPTAAAAKQIGTVKAISGNGVTLTTDAGQQVAVSVVDGARILQLAPGSTDLKSAQTITLNDIAVGDRVLVTGKAGEQADALAALRVILMKSSDIAQKRETEQADWQKRGTGGIVNAVDGTGTLTVSAGAKKIQVQTSSSTKFRRYAGDSVKFEDTKPSTFAQIQAGDQLRVRGSKSEDGLSIQAEEVVSGSFKNLAGTIATVDAGNGTLTLKDLGTKKMMIVKVTANSDVRRLPPQAAQMFAARARNVAPGAGGTGATQAPAQSGEQALTAGGPLAGPGRGPGAGGGMGRSAGMDLSQMLSRLPTETVTDLKVGDAVMIVASQAEPGSPNVTAVTLLSGVEPILAATPNGNPAMTLSPWNLGGGAPDGGGSQ